MARITVEDCILNVSNPFELVILAARRARDIAGGADPMLSRDLDKNTMVALREIASGLVDPQRLRQSIVDDIASGRPSGVPSVEDLHDLEGVTITESDGDEEPGEEA